MVTRGKLDAQWILGRSVLEDQGCSREGKSLIGIWSRPERGWDEELLRTSLLDHGEVSGFSLYYADLAARATRLNKTRATGCLRSAN